MRVSSTVLPIAGVEQLGDTEIQQLGVAFGGHQDVGGLEVAVDDQVLVRVLDRVANGVISTQPLRDGQALTIA